MDTASKHLWVRSLAAACLIAWGAPPALAQQAPKTVRIGWAVAKTGPNAGGTAATVTPNYRLWVEEINAAGGLMLKAYGKRVPVEVVEYDDRSSAEEAVRATERLMTHDKVDFVLPPWGTASNLAVAPTYEKHQYPLLAATSVTDKAPELVQRWKHAFFFLGTSAAYAEQLLGVLARARDQGRIDSRLALAHIADGFGVELATAARKAAARHGFELVYDKSYPIGSQDLAPLIGEVRHKAADSFIAFSYPPDSMLLAEQARLQGLAPKIMFLGVGAQFPMFKQKFGTDVQAIMAPGGVDFDSPLIRDYFRRHKALAGYEPDRFASTIQYTALQMLQQAIERVGRIDRAAVTQELRNGRFETVIGPVKLDNQMLTKLWYVGQWQDGEFHGIAPATREGARPALIPKPAWKN